MVEKKNRGLGRGLSALLADVEEINGEEPLELSNDDAAVVGQDVLPIEFLAANKDQPRRDFDQQLLESLAASIEENGLIQPIVVKMIGEAQYQIVAGERRWRAAQIAKLHQVPVVIRDYTDQEVQEIALIENIQRTDLNPIEEANAYQGLMKDYGHTQEQLSKVLGKSRSHIANMVRLLNLPEAVLAIVRRGELSMGHARALLASDDPAAAAQQCLSQEWSVRQLERFVQDQAIKVDKGNKASRPQNMKDADTAQLEQEISANLGMKLRIDHKPDGKGAVTISYKDMGELDRIVALLGK